MTLTAAQLIEALKTLPPDALVVANGYEGGYDDISVGFRAARVVLNDNPDKWEGRHRDARPGQDNDAVTVFVIA